MLTEIEIAEASHKLALETLHELADLAEEMEDFDLMNKIYKGYADFMLPYHKKIRMCS